MSAEPTNILPFPTTKPTLDQLVASWIEAKRKEDAANAERLAIEQAICEAQPPKEEGSCTTELAGGMKLTLTGKLTYKAEDLEALRNITRDWDGNLVPLKTTTALDPTGCKWLRANKPDLWAQLAKVITVTPAKPAVKVGF